MKSLNNTNPPSSFLSIALCGALLLPALEALAEPASGSLYFASETSLDGADYLSATTLNFDAVFTIGASGDFAVVPAHTPVSMNSLQFDSFSGPSLLWSVTSGPNIYSFNLTSISIDNRTASALALSGTGVLSGAGEDTIANWSLGLNSAGQGVSISFSTEQIAPIPEPQVGWMCALVLAGFAGFALRQRRQAPRIVPLDRSAADGGLNREPRAGSNG